jgi:hypothetical protein
VQTHWLAGTTVYTTTATATPPTAQHSSAGWTSQQHERRPLKYQQFMQQTALVMQQQCWTSTAGTIGHMTDNEAPSQPQRLAAKHLPTSSTVELIC